MGRSTLEILVKEAEACRLCAPSLPHEPRPVLRVSKTARILVVGQAPGAKVHASGAPWEDASGDHLVQWLGVNRATFDDDRLFAILPMGFCWPGRRAGGDHPPRPECAPTWHPQILPRLPKLRLLLLVGQYAQKYYLAGTEKKSLTETVRSFEDYLPERMPLPHPSWRSKLWMAKNPWFEKKLLPVLRESVQEALA